MAVVPWITVCSGKEGATLVEGPPVQWPHNPQQPPSFVTLIGKRTKSALLSHLLDLNEIRDKEDSRSTPCAQVFLRAEHRQRTDRSPLIFIDCAMNSGYSSQHKMCPSPGSIAPRRIEWLEHGQRLGKRFANTLCTRVFAPFSSVLCYFAADLGGLRGVAVLLAEHITTCKMHDLPAAVSPRILVIFGSSTSYANTGEAEIKLFRLIRYYAQILTEDDGVALEIESRLDSIRTLALPKDMTIEDQAVTFQKRISLMSHDAQNVRSSHYSAFSYGHFQALSSALLDHFCSNIHAPFSFIKASRPIDFTTAEFSVHLRELVDQMPSEAWLWHAVIPLLSSALALAVQPPGSHRNSTTSLISDLRLIIISLVYTPSAIFKALFYDDCKTVMSEYTIHEDIWNSFLRATEEDFCSLLTEASRDGQLDCVSLRHANRLRSLHHLLASVKSHKSCFCCSLRSSEKVLQCDHAICDTCIKIFGVPSQTERYAFSIHECMLCGVATGELTFHFLPPTAGIRILTLDGGGVRGIIPLVFLEHLEKSLQIPMHEAYDLVYGTSAGES